MVEFQHGELLMWGPLLSPNMGYTILEDFEKSAQEPTVRFNIQPATYSTGFSDFQLSKVDSSNHFTVVTLIFPPSFPMNQHPCSDTDNFSRKNNEGCKS